MIRLEATTRPDASRCNPRDPVADDGQGQVEIGRRLDEPDPSGEVEVDDLRFERIGSLGLWIRLKPHRAFERPIDAFEAVDRGFDRPERQARRRRRSRASRLGPSPRRSRPSRSRWPSRRKHKRSATRELVAERGVAQRTPGRHGRQVADDPGGPAEVEPLGMGLGLDQAVASLRPSRPVRKGVPTCSSGAAPGQFSRSTWGPPLDSSRMLQAPDF